MTDQTYSFTISGGYTPATIPMERLAEYMSGLSKMLGEEAFVHFESVVDGSVALRAKVDEPARPKVLDRVQAVRTDSAPADLRKHYDRLDEMLRKDNAYGALAGEDNVVVAFPGRNRPEPIVYGPFKQQGTIDGEVYRIGGKDATKHVNIRSGDQDLSVLYANHAIAMRLRHFLFGGLLRFTGEGTWFRHGNGQWELRTFRIDDFEELADESLIETVAKLRAVTGDAFAADPVVAILRERRDEGEAA